MFRVLKLAAIVVAGLGIGNMARAELIVNFDARTPFYTGGQGALGLGGTTWNNGSSTWTTGASNLLDSNGVATTVSVARGGTVGGSGSVATAFTNNLSSSYFYTTSPSGMIVTISGLEDSKKYDLYLYGSQDNSGGGTNPRGSTFTVGGVSQQTIGVDATCAGGAFVLGKTHVVYSMIAPTSGSIVVTVTPGLTEGIGFFNGFQIHEVTASTEVPEPSTMVLLLAGVATIGIFWRRSRRRHEVL